MSRRSTKLISSKINKMFIPKEHFKRNLYPKYRLS